MYHISILSSIDGHLGCFHVLAIVNSAAMNIGMHVFRRISVFISFSFQICTQEWDCWIVWVSLVAQMVNTLPAMQEDPDLIPGSGRSLEEGNGYPLHYSYLENSMDREACQATSHRVTKSWTQLSD